MSVTIYTGFGAPPLSGRPGLVGFGVANEDGSGFYTLAADGTATYVLTNPMTASGSMVVGGAMGVPLELEPGTDGDVLTMVSGAPAWAASSGGGIDWDIYPIPFVSTDTANGTGSSGIRPFEATTSSWNANTPGAPTYADTGTTTTGKGGVLYGFNQSSSSFAYVTTNITELRASGILLVPTLSGGGDTFIAYFGFLKAVAANSNLVGDDMVGFQVSGSTLNAVTVASTTATTTAWGTAVTAGAAISVAVRWRRADGEVDFYVNNVFLATHNTNIPTADVRFEMDIIKSAGTTSRRFQVSNMQGWLVYTP